MVKTIVKRDGSTQDFNPDKLNRWADWASDKCGVSWSEIVLGASKFFHDMISTDTIQDLLIEECLKYRNARYSKMAARLLLGKIYKEAYSGAKIPTVSEYYHKAVKNGWWADMGYSDEELDQIETIVNHNKDFEYTYSTIKQFYDKYAVDVGRKVESPQMAFIGIAMMSMRNENSRMNDIKNAYKYLSNLNINLPTPTLNGLRTPLQGSPSCCVISSKDTTESIGAATHLAYSYTSARSGIGIEYETRAPKEPVKGGRVEHGGKYSIYKHLQTGVSALTQVTRGGSATVTYTCLDPEVTSLLTMKQQRTSDSYRIDHLDYSLAINEAFLKRVAKNEDWNLISVYYAPELYDAFYAGDEENFEKVYKQVELTKSEHITKVKARDVAMRLITARAETGRNYLFFVDNANKHTPFKEPIRLLNLCQEIALPTKPYNNIFELNEAKESGEVALCFLSAIVADDYSDEEYEDIAYYTAKMIDNIIDQSVYPFKQVEYTAKKRRSIGVGITNLAGYLAKNGWKYDNEEGLNAIHRLAERHSYFLHKASVRLAKERGACEWMNRTKYADGWTPLADYSKEVDKYHTQELVHDWNTLSQDIKKYGVRFSVLEAFMPCESSSVFSNSTSGLLPVRSLEVFKQSRKGSVFFQVPYFEEAKDNYQFAWDIDNMDMAKVYGVIQKFAGQTISADFFHDFSKEAEVSASDMIRLMLLSQRLGLKSWYYLNFKVTAKLESVSSIDDGEDNCDSCKL